MVIAALGGGAACLFLYKLYLYVFDRVQFEDSNALVSLVIFIISSALVFIVLKLVQRQPRGN
jgi:ABC-type sugar transport system permease subunit